MTVTKTSPAICAAPEALARGRAWRGGLSAGFETLLRLLNGFGTLGIVALMVLINADIFGRVVLDAPIMGVPELVRIVIVSVVFLQAPHTLACGRMTRSTLGLDVIARLSPTLARGCDALFHLIGAGFFAALVWGAWPQLVKSWARGEYFGSRGIFTAPVWPAKIAVLVGAVLLALMFLVLAWRCLRGTRP